MYPAASMWGLGVCVCVCVCAYIFSDLLRTTPPYTPTHMLRVSICTDPTAECFALSEDLGQRAGFVRDIASLVPGTPSPATSIPEATRMSYRPNSRRVPNNHHPGHRGVWEDIECCDSWVKGFHPDPR